jgi:hypothetical protein
MSRISFVLDFSVNKKVWNALTPAQVLAKGSGIR